MQCPGRKRPGKKSVGNEYIDVTWSEKDFDINVHAQAKRSEPDHASMLPNEATVNDSGIRVGNLNLSGRRIVMAGKGGSSFWCQSRCSRKGSDCGQVSNYRNVGGSGYSSSDGREQRLDSEDDDGHRYVHPLEGQSLHRPPLFTGVDYNYWKIRMMIHIKSQDNALWRIVRNGRTIPTKIVDGKRVPKDYSEYTPEDDALDSLNSRAMHILYCALDRNEFNRISSCTTAKEIWDTLEVVHEGTNQVKDAKLQILMSDFELFSMKEDETITSMYIRFTNIVNDLSALGKKFDEGDLVAKILRALPKSWDMKRTAVQELNVLKKLKVNDLIGSLMTHEISQRRNNEKKDKKKKGIAIRAALFEDQEDDRETSQNEDDDICQDLELMFLFAKMMKKYKNIIAQRRGSRRKDDRDKFLKKEEIICFDCKKFGHKSLDCPLKKSKDYAKKEKFKKAFQATWNELAESDEEDNGEIANMFHGHRR